MFDNFNLTYNTIMESVDSNRKSIEKVDAMSPKQFINFLREFLPFINDGKINLNDIRITEKIDGNAISLAWIDNDMLFESSYSGLTTYNNVPFKSSAIILYKLFKEKFNQIYKEINSNFKIKGELLENELTNDSKKITPVCASYLSEKFGTYGGIVIFEIYKINNDNLERFDSKTEDKLKTLIKQLNNENFKFYFNEDITLNDHVSFTLDQDLLLQIINDEKFNKNKFTKDDKELLLELKKIQNNVVDQLYNIVDNTQGSFSEKGDLIEGIVLKIISSGNQYGIFSKGYKDQKHIYWEVFDKYERVYNDFLKELFGYSIVKAIKNHWKYLNFDFIKNNFDKIREKYLTKGSEGIINIINSTNIPKELKNTQISMLTSKIDKIKNIKSVNDFINLYINED